MRRLVSLVLVLAMLVLSSNINQLFAFSEKQNLLHNFGITHYDPECAAVGDVPEPAVGAPASPGDIDLDSLQKYADPENNGQALGGPTITPTAIMLHWTAGAYANDPNDIVATLRSRTDENYPNGRQVQLFVNDEGTVYQLTESLETKPVQTMDDDPSWNNKTIGIEIESVSSEDINENETALLENSTQYQAVLGLVKKLMERYDIPAEQNAAEKKGVFGHYEANAGNSDPGENFMAKIRTDISGASPAEESAQTPSNGECVCIGGGATALRGDSNIEKIFNYFIDKGLTPEQAAGPAGNAVVESQGDPNALAPAGTAGPVSYHGIFQWDATDRFPRLESFARATGRESSDLGLQLDYAWYELKGEPDTPAADQAAKASHDNAYNALIAVTTVDDAADAWTEIFEVGAGAAKRRVEAQRVYDEFAGGGGGGGAGVTTSGGGCGGGTFINTDGYAFPLEIPLGDDGQPDKTQLLGAGAQLPCMGGATGCHHDGSAAFDLTHTPASATLGKKVLAIHSGRIHRLTDNYKDENNVEQPGCFSIMFEQTGSQNPEDDGWKYWYGHLRNPTVSEGQEVEAGEVLAEVGELRCAKNTIEHLHIDRGSPKGTAGGSDSARDAGLIDLINSLYEEMP